MLKYARAGAAATAMAAALLLTGCSGSSGSSDEKYNDSPPSQGESAGPDGQSPSGAKADGPEGVWAAKTENGVPIVLSISGRNAALLGEHACTGAVSRAEEVKIDLKCPDGNTDRTTGKATPSADGKTMRVVWDGGIEDAFTRSADGKLPEGLSTALPTELGLPSS